MLTPCLLFQKESECTLTVRGGTMIGMAPTTDAMNQVLLPHLRKMGVEIDMSIVSHGYFPDLIGEAKLTVKSISSSLKPFYMTSRGGELKSVDVYVNYTRPGPAEDFYLSSMLPKLKDDYLKPFNPMFHEEPSKVPIKCKGHTIAISCVLRYANDTMLHTSILVEVGKAFNTQTDYARQLTDQVIELDKLSEVCVDENFCDQVLIYAVMAKGTSKFSTTKDLTLHTTTMLDLLPMLCDAKITTKRGEGGESSGCTLIEIEGLDRFSN